MKKILISILVFSVAGLLVSAQKRTITGKVSDNSGSPLRDVLILIDGKNTPVKTGENGFYRIKVRESAETIGFFHFAIGAHEFPIEGRSQIDFVYSDKAALPEADQVEIGYGTRKKEDVTASVNQVDADEINLGTQGDIWRSIAARVPGLEVIGSGSNVRLQIRGVSSINASTEPLILVDGHPVSDISAINPHDIDKINVIKDSSTAIYGTRGANGVILITTKKAR